LIRKVLGSEYLELKIDRLVVEEGHDDESTRVHVELSDTQGLNVAVDGSGVGLVDAMFHALLERYSPEYQSLNSIELAQFNVQGKIDTKKAKAGVDSVGEVVLQVRNSEGKLFDFSDASRSVSRSAAQAVLLAVEYFVNAERAFITLYRSRQDAKERGRDDLVTRYTRELSEVVKSTSYTEVIENMKKEL
jgi:hypothetical protein